MNATLTKNPEYSTKSVLLVRYPEKYRPLGLGHSRTQRSTNDSDPAARSHSRQIRLLIWNQLENSGAPRTLYRAEYVLALAIGFILTKWNLVHLYGKDGTIEYSPNVLEYPRVRLGKYNIVQSSASTGRSPVLAKSNTRTIKYRQVPSRKYR